jgi:hypothetical protein
MSQVYCVCATPGSSGNFLVKLIRNLIGASAGMTPNTFSLPKPDIMTRDFWFDNIEIGDNPVVSSPYRPDYQKLQERFPGCKIIVTTHIVSETIALARNLWEGFYKNSYEFGAEPFFRTILETHSHLFSSTTLTPDQLTKSEISTFVEILRYQKILDGFHNLTVPTEPNILEIKHRSFYFQPELVREQLETFTGYTFTEPAITFHNELVLRYIENSFNTAAGNDALPVLDH